MNLYRRRTFRASLVLLLACSTCIIALGQRRKVHKLRATALLELTTEPTGVVTARLFPVAILDQGIFYDASSYKATPKPMALQPGVVYEGQKAGQAIGYLTITNAANSGGWAALGKWQLASAVPKAKPTPAPTPPPGADRPILHRSGENQSNPAPTPAAEASPTPGSSSEDRPILHRGENQSTPTPSPAAAEPSATTTPTAVEVVPEDPDRPLLHRHGAEEAAEPMIQPRKIPSPAGAVAAKKGSTPTPGLQTMVAVSDTESTDSRSFQFIWKAGEQAKMEAKIKRLALAQLPRENPPLTERALTKVVIRSFDLDLSNDAVMVLSAEVPASGVTTGKVSRFITLIARIDLDGNPQRLAVSVTDSSRLDVAPRLELIDAVDVDGDGYAELLFREYSFDEKSFIIYSIGRGTVTKVFEGASSPLK